MSQHDLNNDLTIDLLNKELIELRESLALEKQKSNRLEKLLNSFAISDDRVFNLGVNPNSNSEYSIPSNTGFEISDLSTKFTQIESELKDKKKEYDILFDSLETGHAVHEIILDEAGNPYDYRYLAVNKKFEEITCIKKEVLLGKTLRELRSDINIDQIKMFGKTALTGIPERYEIFSDDINKFLEVSVYSPKQGQFAIILIDATARKITEIKLIESQRKLELVLANTPLAVVEYGLDSKIVSWNKAAELMFGYTEEEARGKSFFDIIISKKDAPEIAKVLDSIILSNMEIHRINENITKDGRVIICEWFNTVVTDADDKIIGLVSLANDVTESKLRESIIKKQVNELESKNAELERFTYTVSHDLKSPLITIKGFLGALKSDIQKNKFERLDKDINRIERAADKMQILLDDLLELSRIGRIVNPPSKFSITEAAKEAIEILHIKIQESSAQIFLQDETPQVYADKRRIVEVFQNLIENAIKYKQEREALIIEIGFLNYDSEVVFFVKDNGIGIEEHYLEKVFGFFEKLNPNSEGSGIGLALVKRIVEIHSGKIWVESAGLNTGATFYFTLNSMKIN